MYMCNVNTSTSPASGTEMLLDFLLQVVDSTDYRQDATDVYEPLGRWHLVLIEGVLGHCCQYTQAPRKVKDLSLEERCPRVTIMTLDEALADLRAVFLSAEPPMFRFFPMFHQHLWDGKSRLSTHMAAIDGCGRFISLLLMYLTGRDHCIR